MLDFERPRRGDAQLQDPTASERLGPGRARELCADDRGPIRLETAKNPPPWRETIGAASRAVAMPAARSPPWCSPPCASRAGARPRPSPATLGVWRSLRWRPMPSIPSASLPLQVRRTLRRCSPGTTAIAATCHGASPPACGPTHTASGSAKSCCSKRRWRPSRPILTNSWRAGPMFRALAAASLDEVLHQWQGLGYYARARNLHACARAVVERHGGQFPDDPARAARPAGNWRLHRRGDRRHRLRPAGPRLDGNVERVVARLFAVRADACGKASTKGAGGGAGASRTSRRFRAGDLMDLGATICTPRRPRCVLCPWRADCARGGGGIRRGFAGAGRETRAAAARTGSYSGSIAATARCCCVVARKRACSAA